MYVWKNIVNYITKQPETDKFSLRPHQDSLTAKYIKINKSI